ncbi:MAG TPA: ATP-dependent sacrificial sulfur transferase LarE [Vicinamibacterales bacterium]
MTPAPAGADLLVCTEKEQALRRTIATWPALLVAYSGGVDSAYLGWAATQVLGDRALCVTADSASYPERHRALAIQIAHDFGFQHEIIRTNEMSRPEYRANPANRCYYCKHELYTELSAIARARGIPAIADGSNADDRGDYRPGRQAAREFGVLSPLDMVGLSKAEIRELSRRAGLPTWDEPASACLSSRIPYFTEVTDEKLRMIEQAESVLRDLGFRVCRVRHHALPAAGDGASDRHDALARLEIGRDELARALDPEISETIDRALRAIGYQHVTIDLRGYRTGSLNDALRLRPI